MAVRFSIAFGISAESWLNQQTQYDLWHAEQHCNDFAWRSLQDREKSLLALRAVRER